ncbi:unnamed protein product [Penicillium manginii]
MSPQEEYLSIIQLGGKVEASKIDSLFRQLPPNLPSDMLGEWNGGFFDTGHPITGQLREIKWIGKSFKAIEDVDPVIIDQGGRRMNWGKWGFANRTKKTIWISYGK